MFKYILSICILLTSSVFAQDNFVVTEKQQVVTEKQQIVTVTNNTAEEAKPYFVLFTSTGCAPCERMKASEVPKLNKYGYGVTVVNTSKDDTWNRPWNITAVPTIYLIDRKTSKRIKGPWVGFVRAETLLKAIDKPVLESKPKSNKSDLRSWIRSNYKPSTQLSWGVSGQSVYDHLCDGSHGTHVFKKSDVSNLELWEALALHDAIHTGKFKP